MTKIFILSGHFSSPPEIDPWTGHRHNYTPSESFQTHWKTLSRSCYGANSASRVLGADGRIQKIVNNYQKLSYSFAPPLLDELRIQAPNVYRRIVEADRESRERLGHGNAIAQPYHNVVLPLARAKDARLQLEWGIESFFEHFKREPEGFWLPHQAVSNDILDLLVDLKVRYILLSPWQAEGIMTIGEGSWRALNGNPAPSNRPFRIDRPTGSLVAFFQNPQIGEAMEKHHYLKDAVKLSQMIEPLLESDNEGYFQNACVPGELFGLDEPFADMCLAALWEKLEVQAGVPIANYGFALDNFPAKELVKLKKGDNEEGTSADCFHGVSRWKSACGCRSGGESQWHQEWRSPLRSAMEKLQENLEDVIDAELESLKIADKDEFYEKTIELVLKKTDPRSWASKRLPPGSDPKTQDTFLELAFGYLWSQSMMQGALWHHADPTLIPARSGLLAALRSLDLLKRHTAQDLYYVFVQDLQKIAINTEINAAFYLEKELARHQRDASFPAVLFILDKILRPRSHYTQEIGPYRLIDLTKSHNQVAELMFRFVGKVELLDSNFDKTYKLDYLLVEDHHEGVSLFLQDTEVGTPPQAFDLTRLPMGEREAVLQLMSGDIENTLAVGNQSIFPLLRKSLVYSRLLNVSALPATRALAELALTRRILSFPENPEEGLSEGELIELEAELSFAKEYDLTLDHARLNAHFSVWLSKALAKSELFVEESVVHYIDRLLATIQKWGFRLDMTVAQALVYEALSQPAQELLKELERGELEALKKLKCLVKLGNLLMIDTTQLRDNIVNL